MTESSGQPRILGGRYELVEIIGRGGMADVWEGRDMRLGRRVAVKELRSDLARDPSFQARFRREAQSAAALNHPTIVAVYDTGEDTLDDGSAEPYIVMEYVDGVTLRQLVTSGRRLMPERSLEIVSGVLDALDYAHRHGIVHRDIKPGNVMLTRSGDVKVMDFGIARAVKDNATTMTSASTVMGTAQYLSPEQARGEVVDARSDLYSTGVLLYELLTGKPPFTGDSPVAIAYQHVSEPPTPPSQIDAGVPRDLDAIVLKALAKSPEDRYQTAADFNADLERALAGGPVTQAVPVVDSRVVTSDATYAGAGTARTRRRGRRSAGFIIAIIVAVAAVIGVGVGTVLFLTNRDTGVTKVSVPSLSGFTIQQAGDYLSSFNLKLGTPTYVASDKPKDTIIDQQPKAGEQLGVGQAVNVTISAGKEETTVPSLVGLTSVDAARTALTDARLNLGLAVEKDSDQPAGYVLSQTIPEGQKVEVGSTVNITVSTGKLQVPSVAGKDSATAISILSEAGFNPQTMEEESTTVPPGIVIHQDPSGGTAAKKGDTVTIYVAVAKPSPTPTTPTPTPDPTTSSPAPTTSAAPTTSSAPPS